MHFNCCDRFNRFMAVMNNSPNCSFLVKKMNEHLARHRSQATAPATQPGSVSVCSVCVRACVCVWAEGSFTSRNFVDDIWKCRNVFQKCGNLVKNLEINRRNVEI